MIHELSYRVPYADTDKMGVVYYANYLVLFERGRTELMRDLGVRYKDLEDDHRVYLPAMEVRCDYLAPVRYDDLIRVRTWIAEIGRVYVVFRYEIVDPDTGKVLARGLSKHPFVNHQWKPVRIPANLRVLLAPLAEGSGPGAPAR